MQGRKASPETCAKIRASRASPEVRAQMSEANKKTYAERKAKGLVKSQIGKKMSPEARVKMSQAAKARQERIRSEKAAGVSDAT